MLLGLLLATAIHLPPIAAFAAGADATDAEKRVFQQAMQAAAAKNYARAKRNLAALVARKPAHPLYRFNYGNILYLETDYAGAVRAARGIRVGGASAAHRAASAASFGRL